MIPFKHFVATPASSRCYLLRKWSFFSVVPRNPTGGDWIFGALVLDEHGSPSVWSLMGRVRAAAVSTSGDGGNPTLRNTKHHQTIIKRMRSLAISMCSPLKKILFCFCSNSPPSREVRAYPPAVNQSFCA